MLEMSRKAWIFQAIYHGAALIVFSLLSWASLLTYVLSVGICWGGWAWMLHRRRLFPRGTRVEINWRSMTPSNATILYEGFEEAVEEFWITSWIEGEYLAPVGVGRHHHVRVINDPKGLWEPGFVVTLSDDDYIIAKEH